MPETIVAVTGTNGKTSTVEMTRQIWRMAGERAASIGTLGVTTPDESVSTGLTTPDIVTFLSNMTGLAREGVTHVAYEASSHGLSQYRNEGLPVARGRVHQPVSATTSITTPTWRTISPPRCGCSTKSCADGGAAVIWADDAMVGRAIERAASAGLARVHASASRGEAIRLLAPRADPARAGRSRSSIGGRARTVNAAADRRLPGGQRAGRGGTGAGDRRRSGGDVRRAGAACSRCAGGSSARRSPAPGAPVYVDYAHTADALEAAIAALRPHVHGRLITVFGAGGDRDQGKRREMGAVAAAQADVVIVTDDNPRGEDPAAIRAMVLAGARRTRARSASGARRSAPRSPRRGATTSC